MIIFIISLLISLSFSTSVLLPFETTSVSGNLLTTSQIEVNFSVLINYNLKDRSHPFVLKKEYGDFQLQMQEEKKHQSTWEDLYDTKRNRFRQTLHTEEETIKEFNASYKDRFTSDVWSKENSCGCGKNCTRHCEVLNDKNNVYRTTTTTTTNDKGNEYDDGSLIKMIETKTIDDINTNCTTHGEKPPYNMKYIYDDNYITTTTTTKGYNGCIGGHYDNIDVDMTTMGGKIMIVAGYGSLFLSPISIAIYITLGILSIIVLRILYKSVVKKTVPIDEMIAIGYEDDIDEDPMIDFFSTLSDLLSNSMYSPSRQLENSGNSSLIEGRFLPGEGSSILRVGGIIQLQQSNEIFHPRPPIVNHLSRKMNNENSPPSYGRGNNMF